jgi:hypothetical protein
METGDGARAGQALAVAVGVTLVLLVLPFVAVSGAPRLKDRHSNPAPAIAAPAMVAVTTTGKLYHDPRCAFIHGRAALERVSVAIAAGLTPCPRCLGVLTGRNVRADAGRMVRRYSLRNVDSVSR